MSECLVTVRIIFEDNNPPVTFKHKTMAEVGTLLEEWNVYWILKPVDLRIDPAEWTFCAFSRLNNGLSWPEIRKELVNA